MDESIELKPCPFCGSDMLSPRVAMLGSLVICYNCEARGPLIARNLDERYGEILEAKIKWNERQ